MSWSACSPCCCGPTASREDAWREGGRGCARQGRPCPCSPAPRPTCATSWSRSPPSSGPAPPRWSGRVLIGRWRPGPPATPRTTSLSGARCWCAALWPARPSCSRSRSSASRPWRRATCSLTAAWSAVPCCRHRTRRPTSGGPTWPAGTPWRWAATPRSRRTSVWWRCSRHCFSAVPASRSTCWSSVPFRSPASASTSRCGWCFVPSRCACGPPSPTPFRRQ